MKPPDSLGSGDIIVAVQGWFARFFSPLQGGGLGKSKERTGSGGTSHRQLHNYSTIQLPNSPTTPNYLPKIAATSS
jgi:hypothetical protein